jgi:tRNA wybutosine-synthesizing protein 1
MWLAASAASAAAGLVWYYYYYNSNHWKDQRQAAAAVDKETPAPQDTPPLQEIQTTSNDSLREEKKQQRILVRGSITIAHGSMTGTCSNLAKQLLSSLQQQRTKDNSCDATTIQMGSTQDWDWWDEFINDEGDDDETTTAASSKLPALLILLIPTYTDGTWPPCAVTLQSALEELQHDWRVAKFPLRGKLHVALFGTGSSEYRDDTMGRPVRQALAYFQKLGAKYIAPPPPPHPLLGKKKKERSSKHQLLHVGDDAVGNHVQETFDAWVQALQAHERFKHMIISTKSNKAASSTCSNEGSNKVEKDKALCGCSSEATPDTGCCQSAGGSDSTTCNDDNNDNKNSNFHDSNAEEQDDYDHYEYPSDVDDDDEGTEPQVMDLEDMGVMDTRSPGSQEDQQQEPREMVTPSQAIALKKEGYQLIGSHSAVKLCRWTKHQLRGRGGCYKHTFYGITSYQCMEATPSLACANKCVFCWRHHKNPVGKEWRWKTDDPYFIVDEAIKAHIRMIKETKGIPGVRMDRWKEAHTVRHCALSLVGEPIMYPRIDEFLGDLHRRKISTFLVTNGQHPVAIETLRPVTQLYVSVDAPTQESLIAIDRPLFRDAWDRLKQSLSSLKSKGQRTVARLTVVKGWNSDEVSGYAQLIALGHVSLVEVKGVTFCGKSDASNLNMSNTPWHHEVVELTQTLKKEIDKIRAAEGYGANAPPEYGLACEHKHSCSVLLARVDQFTVEDAATGQRKWMTWIDYDKFHELVTRQQGDSSFVFGVQDYTAETPAWALFGAQEEGFDPTDMRHRKRNPKYTQFDSEGIPTHNDKDVVLSEAERARLRQQMEQRQRVVGAGSTVTELRGGEREIQDASLMYRGLTVVAE